MELTKGASAAGRTRRVLVTVAALGVAIAAAPAITPRAQAAEGDIAFQSCTVATEPTINGQPPTGTLCADQSTTFRSLNQPADVAAAENGHVYATGIFLGRSVTHLTPDETTGDLTIVSCVDAGAAVLGCDDLGLGADDPLKSPIGIATYEDDVYVADQGSGSVVHLRAGADGELSFADCITVGAPTTACTDVSGTTDALEDIFSITVTPDGENVYVGSANKSAITNLSRTASGALAFEDCITGGNFSAGTTGCVDISPSGTSVTGAIDPAWLAADPSGNSIYMTQAGLAADVLVQLNRGVDGTLSFDSCLSGPINDFGCTQLPEPQRTAFDGLAGIAAVDGHIYLAAAGSDSVIHLERGANGDLGFADCITSDSATAECDDISDPPESSNALEGAHALDLAPFGDDLLVGSDSAGAVSSLDRTFVDGTLSFGDCVTSKGATTGCGENISAQTNVLDDIADVTAAPDGQSVYTVGNNPDGATRLSREPATIPDTAITSGPGGPTTDATPTFGFSSTEPGIFSCQVDGGPFSPCASPATVAALADGDHTFSVRATDTDGHEDPTPAERAFSVDTTVGGSASAKKGQKQKGQRIAVKANISASEDLNATGSGKIKVARKSYKLKKQAKSISPGSSRNLKLKPKKSKDAKKIAKALKKGKKAKAMLTVKMTDDLGNEKSKKLSVKLRG